MSNGKRKRWGYPVLVACSLVMGLSLWLHYSVSDAADSFDQVAKKVLDASRKAQTEYKAKISAYALHAADLQAALHELHRGPYLVFLNPGCEATLSQALIEGGLPPVAFAVDQLEVSKAHLDQLSGMLGEFKTCPKAESGFTFVIGAYERKKSQWDVWTTDQAGSNRHVFRAKLPATRAHRIKQIAIVLLVLGALGLVSLLIPRFVDRFYIRDEETNVPE